jgi:regulator of sigma D
MGLFSDLMGEKDGQHARTGKATPAQRPGQSGIAYDEGLVDALKDEHQQLLHAFGAIRRAGMEGKFAHTAELLDQFRLGLLNHIALENVRFYVYMQNHPELDAPAKDFIAGVRKEMNVIARTVAKFVDTYLAEPLSHHTVFRFHEELDEIGAVLAKRIDLEETRLYSLYRP